MSTSKAETPIVANQHLIIELLLHLGAPYDFLGKQLKEHPYPENWRKAQRELLEAFPFMLSNQLRDLFTAESCETPMARLQDLTACAHTVLRLVSAVLLADAWRYGEAGELQLLESEKASICQFFNATEAPAFSQVLISLTQAFEREKVAFFLPAIATSLNDKGILEAIRYFQTYTSEASSSPNYSEAEEHLTQLLLSSLFLTTNEFVVIKNVATDWTRDFDEPAFVQHEALLKGQDYCTAGVSAVKHSAANYSRSVLLVREGTQREILNLSPFLVDQNSYKVKSYHLPKVYFLIAANEQQLMLQHSDANDLFFQLQREEQVMGYVDTSRLFVAWDKFCHTFELFD